MKPKIFCSYTKMVKIEDLKPHPKNPNKHPEKQVELLAKIIEGNGWRNPIVVSKLSGFVIKGHGRLESAKKLGHEKVPVDFQEYESEAQELQDLVADNRIAELSEIDENELSNILKILNDGNFDMNLTGFDKIGLKDFMSSQEEGYTGKIISPIYSPKGNCPEVSELFDRKKTEELLSEIDSKELPKEVVKFLKLAAERHTVFDFQKIAEFYCHADKQTQEMMEKSALIIIDFKKAIENGFVKLTQKLGELTEKECDEE